jgi:hypothetical protein
MTLRTVGIGLLAIADMRAAIVWRRCVPTTDNSYQLKALKARSIYCDVGFAATRMYEMCFAESHCERK